MDNDDGCSKRQGRHQQPSVGIEFSYQSVIHKLQEPGLAVTQFIAWVGSTVTFRF